MRLDDWNHVMAVNVTGVMLGCKHGARLMRRNSGGPSGSIVNMSSVSGILASPGPGYSTSKAAVRLMTKAIAADFAFAGVPIRCNSVHPGAVETPIFAPFRNATPAKAAAMKEALDLQLPMGRMGRAEEIAAMVLFVASDEASFSTGAEFVADGGGTATFAAPRRGSWLDQGAPHDGREPSSDRLSEG
jgi:NAD(P)-dependent dehydrogenase (short-subunit alcohol dehydrogenase family)